MPLEKKDEIVANVIWRFFELRGYVFSRRPGIAISLALVASIAHLMRGCDTNLDTFFFSSHISSGFAPRSLMVALTSR